MYVSVKSSCVMKKKWCFIRENRWELIIPRLMEIGGTQSCLVSLKYMQNRNLYDGTCQKQLENTWGYLEASRVTTYWSMLSSIFLGVIKKLVLTEQMLLLHGVFFLWYMINFLQLFGLCHNRNFHYKFTTCQGKEEVDYVISSSSCVAVFQFLRNRLGCNTLNQNFH